VHSRSRAQRLSAECASASCVVLGTISQLHKGGGTNNSSVRLAPNDEESATMTFNTGVAHGSIMALQFFNIFINALLRMLTFTGQNEDISHGPQIGKDQKGDNQRDENGYQFNKIGFIDEISIFSDTPEGMQKLLNVVQEFTAWCGTQINQCEENIFVVNR